ncbi:MAG: hypothetical protein ACFFDP_06750 [Promethearchaeota archaeon]
MTSIGLRLWEKLLYRVVIILLILVALQALLFVVLTALGFIPPRLADISPIQLLAILVCSASITLLAVLGAPAFIDRRELVRHDGNFLQMVIPLRVEHECIIFQYGKRFLGLGFILLPQKWEDNTVNIFLKTLAELECSGTLRITRDHEGQIFRFFVVSCWTDDLDQLMSEIAKTCKTVHEGLTERGVHSEWVKDKLGVEQLYWLCVLGKGFGDDVLLHCEENLVETQIGDEKSRLLVALNLLHDHYMVGQQKHSQIEVLDILSKKRPFLLSFSLQLIAPDIVAKILRQTAMDAPELSLLVEALGETTMLQAYGETNTAKISEVATLLAGRKEGLWQYSYHLICKLTDAPILTGSLESEPHLLSCRGFAEIAICHPTDHQWINTSRLMKILATDSISQEKNSDDSSNGR